MFRRCRDLVLVLINLGVLCAGQAIPKLGSVGSGVLGSAYKTEKESFVGQECVEGTPVPTGQSESSFNLDVAMSESAVSNALGFAADARARYGLYEVSAQASFYSQAVSNNLSVSSVFSSYYSFPTEKLTSIKFTDLGKQVDPNDDRWNETCGDTYVAEMKRGARLFISIRVDFATVEQKQDFQAKVKLDGPALGISAEMKNASKSLSKNVRVTISAYQMGGDVSKVTDIFPNDDTGRSTFVNCTLGQFDSCAAFLSKALKYALDTTSGFPSQLAPNDKNIVAKAAVLEYTLRPYSAMGRYNKNYPLLTAEVGLIRKELLNKWNNAYALSIAADRVLLGKLVPVHRASIEAEQKKIVENRSRILKVSQTCYERPLDCPDAFKALALDSIDAAVIVPDSFRTFCEGAQGLADSDPQKNTVESLIQVVDPYGGVRTGHERVDCYIYDKELRQLTQLSLHGYGPDRISDISPLASLTRLTFLDISHNSISDLGPLATLANLEYFDATDNKIGDLSPLSNLNELQYLDLSANRISDLTGLSGLAALGQLRLSSNRITDLSPLNNLNLISLEVMNNNISDLSNYKPAHEKNLIANIDGNPVVSKIDAKFITDFQNQYNTILTWNVPFDPNFVLPPKP